jgi:hypothetical protein
VVKSKDPNSADFSGAVDLFTITTAPLEGVYTVSRFENDNL